MPQLTKDVVLGLVIFLVFGPMIGGVVLSLGFMAVAACSLHLDAVIFAVKFSPNFVLLSHFVAAIPAAITGVLAGFSRPYLAQRSNQLLMGLLSALISMSYLFFISRKMPDEKEFFSFVCPSFVAGTVLSWFFQRRPAKDAESQASSQ